MAVTAKWNPVRVVAVKLKFVNRNETRLDPWKEENVKHIYIPKVKA